MSDSVNKPHTTAVRSRRDVLRDQQSSVYPKGTNPQNESESVMEKQSEDLTIEELEGSDLEVSETEVTQEHDTDESFLDDEDNGVELDEVVLEEDSEIDLDETDTDDVEVTDIDVDSVEEFDEEEGFDLDATIGSSSLEGIVGSALTAQNFRANVILNVHLDDENILEQAADELAAYQHDPEDDEHEGFNFNLPIITGKEGRAEGFMLTPIKKILEMVHTFNSNPILTIGTDVMSGVVGTAALNGLVERALNITCNVNFAISDIEEEGIVVELSEDIDTEVEAEDGLEEENENVVLIPFSQLFNITGFISNSVNEEGEKENVLNIVVGMRIPELFARFEKAEDALVKIVNGVTNNFAKLADAFHAEAYISYTANSKAFVVSDFHAAMGSIFREEDYTVLASEDLIYAAELLNSEEVSEEELEDLDGIDTELVPAGDADAIEALSPLGAYDIVAYKKL